MASREATHAGSWYSANKRELSSQLDGWLKAVPAKTECIGTLSSKQAPVELPSSGARAIIAPHAGYAYSGPAAAWAYKSLDWSKCKRVFLLGPSHHYYLSGCSLSKCHNYETPLGSLQLDLSTISELQKTGLFETMSISNDEAEHSLEMHLPYIYKMLSLNFPNQTSFPPLIPILVGATTPASERRYGNLLAPYLSDLSSVFIVSSDFCHWGSRFRYTYYQPNHGKAIQLRSSDKTPNDPPVHDSIARVDKMCMDAVETGKFDYWQEVLEDTGNTVCGRHPIGVVMAAIEAIENTSEGIEKEKVDGREDESGKRRFRFVRYERSSHVLSVRDSSVSYCSAFVVF